MRELLGSDASEEEAGQLSKFELANGGTLYLEQIEYLPAEMQSALLQVLKTGVVIRLNSSRVIPVDVRVIAGSAADLPLLVQQNRFRRQLFYSLQAFEIQIRRCAGGGRYSAAGQTPSARAGAAFSVPLPGG